MRLLTKFLNKNQDSNIKQPIPNAGNIINKFHLLNDNVNQIRERYEVGVEDTFFIIIRLFWSNNLPQIFKFRQFFLCEATTNAFVKTRHLVSSYQHFLSSHGAGKWRALTVETEVVPARIAHDIVENIEEIFCNVRRRDILK